MWTPLVDQAVAFNSTNSETDFDIHFPSSGEFSEHQICIGAIATVPPSWDLAFHVWAIREVSLDGQTMERISEYLGSMRLNAKRLFTIPESMRSGFRLDLRVPYWHYNMRIQIWGNPEEIRIRPTIGAFLWMARSHPSTRFFDENAFLWLPCDGSTIGLASGTNSGAFLQDLYLYLHRFTTFTGKTANALADWQANRTMPLPDARGRCPIGAGQGGGLSNRSLGSLVGAESTTLTAAQMPSHNHAPSSGSFLAAVAAGSGTLAAAAGNTIAVQAATANAGSGQSHTNMQPSYVASCLIATGKHLSET